MRAKTLLFIGFMAFLAATIVATPGYSQAPADEFLLEDTIVTATKREESIQDIPISVTAFSGDRIRELGYMDTIDITQQTPGFNVIRFHPTLTMLNIRGISQTSFSDDQEAPVAAYVDDAYQANMSSVSVQMFDMERVEVLRGPQGTLFGRNATGGLVHYVSAAPTEEFQTYGSLTYGSYQDLRLEGVVSGSLAENLQARFSAMYHRNDGLVENDIGPDLHQTDAYALRLQFAWQPTVSTDVRLKLHHAKDDPDTGHTYQHAAAISVNGLGVKLPPGTPDWNGYADTDGDLWRGAYDEVGYFNREINGATLRINASLSPQITLVSITDYNDMEKAYLEDVDSSPFPYFRYWQAQDYTQFSQELRLNSEKENLRWQVGLYYLDIENNSLPGWDLDYHTFGIGTPDFGYVIQLAQTDATIDTRSWAVFGEGEYDFNEQLALTLGLRYSDDRRELTGTFTDNFSPNPQDDPLFHTDRNDFDNWSYRAILNWRPSEDTLLFAGVNQTHKAGGFRLAMGYNFSLDRFANTPHDEEVLRSFEIGLKKDLMGGKARLNATAFYYDYSDFQAFVVDPTSQPIASLDIINLDAEAYGGELELSAYLTEGLYTNLGIALMDSTVKDVTFPDFSVGDSELPYAPTVSLNGLARYAWEVAGGEASIQFDFNYQDDITFSVLRAPLDLEDSYFVGNVRARYIFPNERWSFTAFATNVFEEEYRVYSLDVSGVGLAGDVWGAQRLFGVTLEYTWN